MSRSAPKNLLRMIGWIVAALFIFATFLLYRWAASPLPPAYRHANGVDPSSAFTIKNAPFVSYENGKKAWSLRAERIDATRQPNAGFANFQNATLFHLRDGKIYSPPKKSSRILAPTATILDASSPDAPTDVVAATFQADQGQYAQGSLFAPPTDMDASTTVLWQFVLTGNVEFKTAADEKFTSQSMTVYNLQKRGGSQSFFRIVCDKGAQIVRKKIQIEANQVRFQPKDGVIECLGGVRGKFPEGDIQTERAYWTLKNETLRCPDTTSGQMRGLEFSANNLNLDIKNERATGGYTICYPNLKFKLAPSLGLP